MAVQASTQTKLTQVKRRRPFGDVIAPYLFITPFLLSFTVLFLGPAIYALVLSFFKYQGYGTATFVGLQNYESTLTYNVFWTMMRNVLFYWVGHSIPQVIFAFLLAVFVHSKLVQSKRLFKPLLFIPQLVAGVAAALLFKNFFSTQYGLLNNILGLQIPWLEDMNLARWVVVVVMVWRGTGYWFVIFLAGLTAISTEVMEAAVVDGASAWQRLVRITIPLMKKTFLFYFVMDAIGSLRTFEIPNVLGTNMGGLAPVDMAPILNIIVDRIRNALFGQAAAAGWLLFVVIAVISWLQFRLFRESK